ncbi:GNAT family N-acetyltransferase [Jannaschia sp. CCS1]|uniref:GNAT family N-acetyltransferase n=1 Tax=Jannaschia sp. (strain CCS1) TaxID=290400 RepID=UPI000053B7BD|nr:GNAT family N-acetyltransferase [Jannaschia sp. CCS1]ABD53199.1 GCN5-related N-acetyltransferase [Jannaschia sp. CCS1]
MNIADLFPVLQATWPAATSRTIGPFIVPAMDLGGNRVSAARLKNATARSVSEEELAAAQAAMAAQGRSPLFQVLDHQTPLSDMLDTQGYITRDPTDAMVIRARDLAATPPPVTAFTIWPPLAIQTEIWDAGGIDAPRRAIMDRASGAKTSLFGRISDMPAGAAYVGLHGDIAMLHALEVAPTARRKGLAAHMMRTAATWASDNGATWLSILVTQQNKGARRLYTSLGLKPVGTYVYREDAGGQAR